MTGREGWRLRLATAAEADFQAILRWTADQFGPAQARTYAETLAMALDALRQDGPEAMGCRRLDAVAPGLMALPVARAGRKGRHFVLYRVGAPPEERTVEALRILHDSMDVSRSLR